MIRMAGIDPGSVTGVVIVDVPDDLAWAGAQWVDGDGFTPTRSLSSEPARDCHLSHQLTDYLRAHRATSAALECPAEAKIAYRGQRRQRTETAFRSGCYYTLAMLAADRAGCWVFAYPAVTSKRRGPGWMANSPRRVVVPRLLALLRAVGAPAEVMALDSENELRQHHLGDALGVLAYHVNDQWLLRRAS